MHSLGLPSGTDGGIGVHRILSLPGRHFDDDMPTHR